VSYYYFLAHQHKAAGVKIELSKNNDHDGVSHGIDLLIINYYYYYRQYCVAASDRYLFLEQMTNAVMLYNKTQNYNTGA